MKYLIDLFRGIVYHKVPYMMLGFSGGSLMYHQGDFIPDSIVFLHRIELN